jgi:CO/xanthine dehydrogenase Mo-binding subunit
MGATAQALGAVVHEAFVYDDEGQLLTPNFYDYHVPHALDVPPLQTGYIESASPFTPLGTKGMGEGGGAGIHAVCAALQDATGHVVYDSWNPYKRVWELVNNPRDVVEVTAA